MKKNLFNIIIPPHYIICPQIMVNQSTSSNNIGFVPLDELYLFLNKYTNQLKLQNNDKTLNYSLENCMKLKCI